MEHESFEDEEVAALINERFIAIKVDREERPDIDDVYMQVTQAMTGSGGWPMTVMMTPDKHPFFAGTYFPKESLAGRPGIKLLITEMHKAWTEKRDEVESTATAISEQLGSMMAGSPGGDLDVAIFDTAYEQFAAQYDAKLGGFAMRPKFPVPPNLNFLMRYRPAERQSGGSRDGREDPDGDAARRDLRSGRLRDAPLLDRPGVARPAF